MATTTDASPVAKTPATHNQRGVPATSNAKVVERTAELSDEMLGSDVDLQPPIARSFYWLRQNEVASSSMALADSQQLRMVERLRAAGKQPVTIGELRGGGIDFPAVVISELELHGYAIERVYEHGRLIGVRLLDTEAPDPPASRRRHRWRRLSR
jgi:hypothetical protein